jgi:two-component system chemotaxis response regulator CheB/chemosensory pili system protein ChpB (putative protein-glutamate methylesterase)
MSTDIRVALVFEQDAGTQGLRTALANAGVAIALECRASALDSSAILSAAVDAIVVNLDAELEELLDEVTEALDLATQPVIYNDPAASSDLSGWDRARWMRHLSAKLKGQSNVTPPPPPGAPSIPTPVKPVEKPATAVVPAPADVVAPAAIESAADSPGSSSSADTGADVGFGDLDLMFAEPMLQDGGVDAVAPREALTVEQPVAASDDSMFDLGLADLDLMFEPQPGPVAGRDAAAESIAAETGAVESADRPDDAQGEFDTVDLESMFDESNEAAPAPPAPQSQSLILGEDLGDLDALFDDAPVAEVSPPDISTPTGMADTVEFEIGSLFAESSTSSVAQLPETVATPTELTDLDALFREFEASQAAGETPATPSSAQASSGSGATPATGASTTPSTPRDAPMEWSLEPVEEELPQAKESDRLVAEWRLDTPSKPLAQTPPEASKPPVAAKPPAAPSIPAELDASLELADLRLLDDATPLAESPPSTGAVDLDAFDLSSLELESIEPAAAAADAVGLDDNLSLTDLDFDFIQESADVAAADTLGAAQSDGGLDDLESLFEQAIEAPLSGLSLPDLNRVFVLGASIGGPEAIKAFLAQLPTSVPAAFIVAQHMGSEFLEMMAMQLDAASPLPVRCPKPGERLRHGEVIVAPANEPLSIDESGCLQMSAAASGSPYNPSIDHLARAAADRFGDHATLILFSGMGSDGVEGGRYLTSRGGQVWAQDRASCVIASMIDSAKSQGLVRFEGTPVQLAERVLQLLS